MVQDYTSKYLIKQLESEEGRNVEEEELGLVNSDDGIENPEQYWKKLGMMRRVSGMEEPRRFAKCKIPIQPTRFFDHGASLLGKRVQPYITIDAEVCENMDWDEGGLLHSASLHTAISTTNTQYCCMALLAVISPVEKKNIFA